jgi:hypothetical protein
MDEMAKGLKRGPQVESILAGRLGVARSFIRQLAISIGFDPGRGRGIGL